MRSALKQEPARTDAGSPARTNKPGAEVYGAPRLRTPATWGRFLATPRARTAESLDSALKPPSSSPRSAGQRRASPHDPQIPGSDRVPRPARHPRPGFGLHRFTAWRLGDRFRLKAVDGD